MSHLVLSRKYRPQRFEDLVGQEAVAQTLRNAITSGRIGHAYLFIGPRGTGKTTTARIFAKALNCEAGPTATPCGTCASCVGIASGNDLDVVEMDAASNNGVDDVRALRDSVGYRPARSRFRVWIVDEVHMLSLPAFNAFLKTLEEPPPQAKFLFCTTEAHKLPETFTSRVQRLEFRRIEEPRMADRLRSLAEREGLAVEDGVCERIAAGALGGLRDAESLLEQLLSCAEGARVTQADLDAVSGRAGAREVDALFVALLEGDPGRALDAAGACLDGGAKPDVVLDQVVDGFRAMLPAAARDRARAGAGGASPTPARGGAGAPTAVPPPTAPSPMGAAAGARRGASAGAPSAAPEVRAVAFGLPRILRSVDLLLEKRRALRDGADARLVVEVACVELASLPSARDLDRLLESLEAEARRGPMSPTVTRGPMPAVVPPVSPSVAPFAPPAGAGVRAVAPRAVADAASIAGTAAGGDASGGPATIAAEEVVARWAEIVQAGERRSRRLASCLGKARLVGVVGDVALLHIPESESIARGVLRDREATDAFREAAREVLGVGLRPALDEGGPRAGWPPAVAGGAGAAGHAAGVAGAGGAPTPVRSVLPPGGAAPGRTSSLPGPASAGGSRLDDVRARPEVKAVLDAFGARVLAIQRVEPAAGPPVADTSVVETSGEPQGAP